MKAVNFILLCLLFFIQTSKAQTNAGKEIYNKDFNWSIVIPENFEAVTGEDWAKMQHKGEEAIEKTFDEKIEIKVKTIFVFKSDQLNYFESNYQLYDANTYNNYPVYCKGIDDMLYQTFITQMQGIKIDTTIASEKISGLEFQTFKMKVTYPNNMVMHVLMFSRLFDKKEFSVNIMFIDNAKGEAMLNSWKHSTFGKNK